MRENHLLQTPQMEHQLSNRRSKSTSDHAKKAPKLQITKKNLNSVFTSVSDDASMESPKNSIDVFSPVSEVSDDNQFGDTPESFLASIDPALSPSSETVSPSDLTLLFSAITENKEETGSVSVNHCGSTESSIVKIGSVEAEMAMNYLKQARIQILNSADADPWCKKLLDTLVQVVMEEFCCLPEEKHHSVELLSTKANVVLLSFFLWILAVVAVFFFSSGAQSSSGGLTPT